MKEDEENNINILEFCLLLLMREKISKILPSNYFQLMYKLISVEKSEKQFAHSL